MSHFKDYSSEPLETLFEWTDELVTEFIKFIKKSEIKEYYDFQQIKMFKTIKENEKLSRENLARSEKKFSEQDIIYAIHKSSTGCTDITCENPVIQPAIFKNILGIK